LLNAGDLDILKKLNLIMLWRFI